MQGRNDITYGINWKIVRAFKKTLKRNDQESSSSFMHFVRNVLQLSFQNKSLKHFEQYIFIPALFYNISFEEAQKDSTLTDIFKDCSSQSSRNLKEILWLDLSIFGDKISKLEAKKIRNPYYYLAFYGFSRLFYFMVKNQDLNSFTFAMREYEQLISGDYDGYFGIKFKIDDLKNENINRINDEQITKLKTDYQILNQFNTYYRHVLTGIKYWIFFLYSEKEINKETTLSFINEIKIPSTDSETILKDIFFFRSNSFQRYMGWDDWDYVERHSGIVYSPPMVTNWITLGFFIDQLRENRIYINLSEIDNEQIHQAIFLYEDLKGYTNYLQNNFEHWKTILKVKTISDLKIKCDNLLSIYAVVKRKSVEEKEKAIAKAQLSVVKINEFKNEIGKAWNAKASIHKLFRVIGNAENVTNNEIKLKNVGGRTFFEKAKIMFIDGKYYQPIVGIDRMGGEIGMEEDNGFFALLFNKKFNKQKGSNVLDVLDKAFRDFNSKKIKADMILLSPEYSYKDKDLLTDSRFLSKRNANKVHEDLARFYLGSFDDVPIFTSHSWFLKNRILICNFKSAFKMLYRTNSNWFDEELNVSVREITDEEAHRKLQENPQKWTETEEGIVLTEEDALILIKTSVMMEIWTTIDFQILNKDEFIIGYIEPEVTNL